MKVLKDYVHSMAQLEGSMAKGYILEETLGFLIEYLHEFEHVTKRVWDVKKEYLERFWKVLLQKWCSTLFYVILLNLKHIPRLWVHGYNKLLSSLLAIKLLGALYKPLNMLDFE
jgi:hypothetical protein